MLISFNIIEICININDSKVMKRKHVYSVYVLLLCFMTHTHTHIILLRIFKVLPDCLENHVFWVFQYNPEEVSIFSIIKESRKSTINYNIYIYIYTCVYMIHVYIQIRIGLIEGCTNHIDILVQVGTNLKL